MIEFVKIGKFLEFYKVFDLQTRSFWLPFRALYNRNAF